MKQQMVLVKQGRFTYDEDVHGTVLLFQIKSNCNRKGYRGSDRLKKSRKEIMYFIQYCFKGKIYDGNDKGFDSIDNALEHANRACRELVWFDDIAQEKNPRYLRLVKKGRACDLKTWDLNDKQKLAIQRLVELGADVSPFGRLDVRLKVIIPFDLHPDVYVEVGYLFAKLGFEDFPYNYSPIADLFSSTELFSGNEETCAVSARDIIPGGFRYYIAPNPKEGDREN